MRNWPLSRARSWVASRGDHMLGRPSCYWQREPKRRATVQLAVRGQFAAHTADDGVGQGEPQPCPSFFDDARIRAAEELRSEEHTSELQSHSDLVCRLLLEKKKKKQTTRQQQAP